MTILPIGVVRSKRAFTYLELMIVLVVIGITTAAIIPSFRASYASTSFRSAYIQLASYLRYAQRRAVAQRRHVQLVITAEPEQRLSFQLMMLPPPGDVDWLPIASRFGRKRLLPRGTAVELLSLEGLDYDRTTVDFAPNGFTDSVQLLLTATNKATVTITVDGSSGTITVDEGNPADE